MRRFLLAALPAATLLSGCLVTSQVGQGPITLSPGVEALYQRYLDTDEPMAFAVTADGSGASYYYCPDRYGCRGTERSSAVQLCQKNFGRPCYIYDHLGEVIWREDLPPLPEG
ncbi:hypothetical protein SH611_02270 [Geminicoccaceae bacterium 1502E]|nr:hypothetical protein [Geminicoccaceae bacterium 1502E]